MSGRVIHGDAGAALRQLPAGSVKLLITDPPYRTLTRGAQVYADGLGFRTLSWGSIAAHLTIARRRLQPDGVAMLVVNRASASEARAAMRAAGFRRQATVTWLNGVQLGGDASTFVRGRRPPPRRDVVVVGLMPSARIGSQRIVRAMPVPPATIGRYPTEKPEYLGAALARVAGVRRGQRVVDPYCGSGALLAGARRLGADVIGIDVSTRAVRLARQRLSAGPSATERPATARRSHRRPRAAPRPPASLSARLARLVLGRAPMTIWSPPTGERLTSLDSGQILGTRRSPAPAKRVGPKAAKRTVAKQPSARRLPIRRARKGRP